jgi:uncharacterized protein
MTPRRDWARGFILAVVIGWILLTAAGFYYARLKSIPASLAAPLIAAFLIEYVFYLVPGFPSLREWLADNVPSRRLALLLALSAMAPYLVYSVAIGQFRAVAVSRLAALVLVLSFFYVLRRPSPARDLALLALIAVVFVTKFFRQIYISQVPQVSILGQLMLIRLFASVMLILRRIEGTGFGFLPTVKEWKIGLRNFLWFLPLGLGLWAGLGMLRVQASRTELLMLPLQFLGMLWVVALFEEFLARGLLQQWLSDWTKRPNLALFLASSVFGLCHLWFPPYPNWKMAIVTAVLGWFCGKAYNEAGGIRAAMVTHALVATLRTVLS